MKEFSTINLIKEIIKANPKLVLELGALAASLR
jgi:digeranylgeranylglycerophospholipid reductase